MKTIIRFICFLMIFTSCSNITNSEFNNEELKSFIVDDKNFREKIEFSEIVKETKYIRLETKNNDLLIGKIDRILFHNGKIFILDRDITKSIFIFDGDGSFLTVIGKIGAGPGEFENPFDITIDKESNNLLVYCRNLRKINYYDLSGNFIKDWRINLEFRSFEYIHNNKLAIFTHSIYNNSEKHGELPYDLIILNTKGKILSKQFANNSKVGLGITVYTHNQYFSSLNNSIYVYWMFNDTIYKLGDDNIARPEFNVNFKSRKIDYNNYSKDSEIFQDIIDGKVWSIYSNVLVSDSHMIFKIAAGKITEEFKNVHYSLYSINNENNYFFHELYNDIDDGIFSFPKAIYDDYFVSVIYPEELLDISRNNSSNINLNGINEPIGQYDNPILFFVKFKL